MRDPQPRPPAPQRSRPYRVLAVSLFEEETEVANRLTTLLRAAGWPRANRSFVIREALQRLDEELGNKSAAEVFHNFVERRAARLRVTATAPAATDLGGDDG
jgi:hypothetical protein